MVTYLPHLIVFDEWAISYVVGRIWVGQLVEIISREDTLAILIAGNEISIFARPPYGWLCVGILVLNTAACRAYALDPDVMPYTFSVVCYRREFLSFLRILLQTGVSAERLPFDCYGINAIDHPVGIVARSILSLPGEDSSEIFTVEFKENRQNRRVVGVVT